MTSLDDNAIATVLQAGLLTCLQDLGRTGFRHLGVGAAGAADRGAYRLACRLMGETNSDHAAIEVWQAGLQLELHAPVRIAAFGAEAEIDCQGALLPLGRPVELPAGCVLSVRRVSRGTVFYLAIDGGWQCQRRLGSLSTDLRAHFGGYQGRALATGDQLLLAQPPSRPIPQDLQTPQCPPWYLASPSSVLEADRPIRFIADQQHEALAAELGSKVWKVRSDSNRQGLRLDGEAVKAVGTGGLLSRAVMPGTIQLPSNGLPIVLGADAQTVGGYAVLGQVIDADLDRLAQSRPNALLRFSAVNANEAIDAYRERRADFARTELAIETRLNVSRHQGRRT